MKVYEIQGSFGIENLKLAEQANPSLGPGEALIRVDAVSLNYRDLLMIKGLYNPKQRLPLIPLSDGVGEVVAVADDVTRVKTGDRVAGIFAQGWISGPPNRERLKSTLGGPLDGVLAEFIKLPEDGLVLVPQHLSDIEAAALSCAATTAWRALVVESQIKAGDTVVLQGTGGVSLFALQFAKLHGARVIITSSSDEKLASASMLGAHELINYRQIPGWSTRVKELTDGKGADVILDLGGAATFAQSILAVRVGGQINLIGQLGGALGSFNLVPLFMRNVRVQGILVGNRDNCEDMLAAVSLHQMRPMIDRVFSFEETQEALTYFEQGKHMGKICIRGKNAN